MARPSPYWLGFLLVALIGLGTLSRSPFSASNLDIPPDECEYAIGAKNLVLGNGYRIPIQGQMLPSRYPPSFSTLFIAPWMFFLGTDPGIGILPVLACGLLTLFLAYRLGYQIAGVYGALGASIALLYVPSFRLRTSLIMTDVPFLALGLLTATLFALLADKPRSRIWIWCATGMVIALTLSLRPVALAFVAPFFALLAAMWWIGKLRFGQSVARILALSLPLTLPVAFSRFYNLHTFGSANRSGYLYWCAVPLDYPHLTFSLANIPMNLRVLAFCNLPLILGGCALAYAGLRFARKHNNKITAIHAQHTIRSLAVFALLAATPITLFHLIYYYPSDRFHLLLVAILAIVPGALLVKLLSEYLQPRIMILLLAIILGVLLIPGMRFGSPPPFNRLAAQVVDEICTDDAIIIGTLNPVYLEDRLNPNNRRLIMPLSRQVEYADKCFTPTRVPNPQPPPLHWRDGRAEGLLAAGSIEVVPLVAIEQISLLHKELDAGRHVYVETSNLTAELRVDLKILSQHFQSEQVASLLYELLPSSSESPSR